MDKSICCIHGCETKIYGKLLCSKHYTRLVRHGSTKEAEKKPKLCLILECRKPTDGRKWCSKHRTRFDKISRTDRVCIIDGCGKFRSNKFLCGTHQSRLQETGTTSKLTSVKRQCRMPGCENARSVKGFCRGHLSRIRRNGSPLDSKQAYIFAKRVDCLACGAPSVRGYREFCSHACYDWAKYSGAISSKACVVCGKDYDLSSPSTPSGRRKRKTSSYCDDCAGGVDLRYFVPKLAKFKGTDCGICSKSIDMTLKHPDPMSRSVDHILPRSLGGGDTIENLSLAHLLCNVRKQNRLDYVAS